MFILQRLTLVALVALVAAVSALPTPGTSPSCSADGVVPIRELLNLRPVSDGTQQ